MLRLGLSALLVLVPLCSSCVAVAAAGVVGAGIVQYKRNEVERDFPNELAEAWQGVAEGLQRLGIEPTESELGPTEGFLAHEDLRVHVESHAGGFTRVRVRAGAFRTQDNLRRAEVVLQEIAASLERQDELRAWADEVKELHPPPPEAPTPLEAPPEPQPQTVPES